MLSLQELLARVTALEATSRHAELLPTLDDAERALEGVRAPRADPRRARLARARVDALRTRGRLTEAAGLAKLLWRDAGRFGWNGAAGPARVALGRCLLASGRLEEAEGCFAEVLEGAEGDAVLRAEALDGLGEVRRLDGREGAAEAYLKAIALAGQAGAETASYRLHLALEAGGRREHAEAEALATAVAARAEGALLARAEGIALAATVALGRVDEAERWEGRARRTLPVEGLVDTDLASLLERATGAAPPASRRLLALHARCLALAFPTWEALDRRPDAERVGAALRELEARGAPIPLGPYDLARPLGSGGMGEVWEARHREEGVAVAVKVLTARAARRADTLATLRSEVRAVARLAHPHIVEIHDLGTVPGAAEAMSAGRLVAGSPALVMELARAGSLLDRCGSMPWPDARALLADLLDALAHAHAQGMVHRDIKPDNVLLAHPSDERPGVKLTDFGLARAIGEIEQLVAGTPSYMAPEQVRAEAHATGPWTDLYALGCLAWHLLCGEPPISGEDVRAILERQLREAPPAFRPRVSVPAGVEAWLRRLLEKAPADRFQRAADARRALDALGAPDLEPTPDAPTSSPAAARSARSTFLVGLAHQAPDDPLPPRRIPIEKAPVPATWTESGRPSTRTALRGAGLRTFGLREVALIGRERERDALWEALRAGEPRAVVVQGPAGVGKSRLADWLARRAHETGAGTPLAFEDGTLVPALVRVHGWTGLTGAALREAVGASLRPEDEDQVDAVASLVEPGAHGVRLDGTGERAAATLAALRPLAAERAVVLRIDDADRQPAALDLARHLLTGPPLHLVVLVCARDDLLAAAPEARRLVQAVAGLPGSRELRVGPLEDAALRQLLGALLRLDAALAERVVARAAGNPLFALELVGELVSRELLAPGPDGFLLRGGEDAPLPDGLHAIWDLRIDAALQGLSPRAEGALEVAAVLGLAFGDREWREVCARASLPRPDALVDRLLEAHLAEREGQAWRLCHGMLREALLRRAAEAGRLEHWHAACAATLQERSAPPARLGHHLAGAGRHREAVGPLLEAAAAAMEGSPVEALVLLDAAEHALQSAEVPPDDRQWGEALLWRGRALHELARFDEAHRVAVRAEESARRSGRRSQLGEALRQQAVGLRVRARLQEAEARFREAVALLEGADPDRQGRALQGLALALRGQGDVVGAREVLRRALAVSERGRDEVMAARCRFTLGAVALQLGDEEEAVPLLEEAARRLERVGSRGGLALCLNGLAELDRKRGDLDRAEARYREALRLHRVTGTITSVFPRLNLALVQLARGRWPEARAGLTEVLGDLERQGRDGLVGAVHAMLLAPALASGDLDAFDRHAAESRRLLDKTGFAEPDVAWAAEVAAEVAGERGETERGGVAAAIAAEQRRRLGRG